MNNDLISRSALKEDFKSRLVACNEWIAKAKDKETKIRASAVKAYLAEVIMTIDNAPVVSLVEPVCEIKVNITEEEKQKLIEELQKPHNPLILPEPEIAFERAQGEWIDHSEDGYVECPFCHVLTNCDGNPEELHYCWNCGAENCIADMRKGGAE